MSPGEIQTFIANAIRNLRHKDGFLHSGSDDEVSRQPSLTRCLLMSHRAMLLGSTIPLSSRLLKSLCMENTASSPSFLTNSIRYVQSPAWLQSLIWSVSFIISVPKLTIVSDFYCVQGTRIRHSQKPYTQRTGPPKVRVLRRCSECHGCRYEVPSSLLDANTNTPLGARTVRFLLSYSIFC